jgi:hypothetical protein
MKENSSNRTIAASELYDFFTRFAFLGTISVGGMQTEWTNEASVAA